MCGKGITSNLRLGLRRSLGRVYRYATVPQRHPCAAEASRHHLYPVSRWNLQCHWVDECLAVHTVSSGTVQHGGRRHWVPLDVPTLHPLLQSRDTVSGRLRQVPHELWCRWLRRPTVSGVRELASVAPYRQQRQQQCGSCVTLMATPRTWAGANVSCSGLGTGAHLLTARQVRRGRLWWSVR